jgi:hypothetical protein
MVHVRLDRGDMAIIRRFAKSDRCTKTDVIRKALRLLHVSEALREQEQRRMIERLNAQQGVEAEA